VNGERSKPAGRDPRSTTHDPPPGKADIRKQVLARRDALSADERRVLSDRITARLLGLPAYQEAACVMAYLTFGSELETAAFVADLQARHKRLVLPRVERGSRMLALREVRDLEHDIESGVWGIRQPRADRGRDASPADIDFVLMPGVAFTRKGARLGYGGGFYDRFIKALSRRPPLVAAAFELQVLDELPMSDTDQWMDRIVTESAEYRRGDS